MNVRHARIPADLLTVETAREGSRASVTVVGRVTVDTSPRLRSALLAVIRSHASTAIIDMSGVSYLDTSGIATLVEASQIAHERTVGLRLVGLTGQPRMLAEIADIAQIFRALGSEVEIS